MNKRVLDCLWLAGAGLLCGWEVLACCVVGGCWTAVRLVGAGLVLQLAGVHPHLSKQAPRRQPTKACMCLCTPSNTHTNPLWGPALWCCGCRARQLAQKTAAAAADAATAPRGPENIAAELIKRREEQQKAAVARSGQPADGGKLLPPASAAPCHCLCLAGLPAWNRMPADAWRMWRYAACHAVVFTRLVPILHSFDLPGCPCRPCVHGCG